MAETITKFTKEQIQKYGEMYNLFPNNQEAIIANMMRLDEKLNKAYIAIERLWAFAQSKDCDVWQLCRLDIDKLKEYEVEDLFNK